MSFQGDVAGIGLGELLQGLARGERNGVLTLTGPKLTACVGLKRGQLFLLAGPDEQDDIWRERAQRAFADKKDPNMESARRAAIARAARLEAFYQMLEAANLHFRFEPGELPPPPSSGLRGAGRTVAIDSRPDQEFTPPEDVNPWGVGLPVEYILLEHARISDEVRTGLGAQIFEFDLPRALDPERQPPEVRDFLEHCDGASTLQEIADRLGWPLMKCRGVIAQYVQAGQVRVAGPRELLAASQREADLGRSGRASTRLAGWVFRSQPGPAAAGDAQMLLNEWSRSRLQRVLAVTEPRIARAVLRRLDRTQNDIRAAGERWKALSEMHKQDELTLLHEVSLQLATSAPGSRTFSELLRLAHSFHERGLERRTRMLLRLCANHLPEGAPIRVELGRRMLDAGLLAEGSRWLLNTAREFLARHDGEAAMLPIRAVLRVSPEHQEARTLLEAAQLAQEKKKRRRWNVAIGLSCALAASLVALVKFHAYRQAERWVVNVSGQTPSSALALLADEFGDDPPMRIAELRARLQRLQDEEAKRNLEDWWVRYREADEICRFGDPLMGLSAALALPQPPMGASSTTPDGADLLGQLASRLGQLAQELDVPVNAPIEALREEERLLDLLGEVQTALQSKPLPAEASSFQFRVQELVKEVQSRRNSRATARETLMSHEREKEQDILLATARAHEQAGDLERSLAAYGRLIESDPALEQIPELKKEIQRVRAHDEAWKKALHLSEEGKYDEAEAALKGTCPRPIEHLLPYQVVSVPPGARVTLSDGRVRTAPFQSKSGFGEVVAMKFVLPGFQDRSVEIQKPGTLVVYMHRFPERTWQSKHKIEAAPVPSGDDHIVADRRGRMARLDQQSHTRWEVELKTLGGIARTPVFMPGKPGWLLVVSEDGQVWHVQAQTGEVDGPREIGSPPVVGPTLTRSGVSIQFADGRVAVWTDRLEPIFYQSEGMVGGNGPSRDAPIAGSIVQLRRSAGSEDELVSPWTSWRVTVTDNEYRVNGPGDKGFTAEKQGEWLFVAWEAPKAQLPFGRLWVSDAGGLRSFLPEAHAMTPVMTGTESR